MKLVEGLHSGTLGCHAPENAGHLIVGIDHEVESETTQLIREIREQALAS
ncbi:MULTISPECIES: hypothetical protein [Cryobacterium]|nr:MULTISPECIES: hypothetical protein [Cryobacterium]